MIEVGSVWEVQSFSVVVLDYQTSDERKPYIVAALSRGTKFLVWAGQTPPEFFIRISVYGHPYGIHPDWFASDLLLKKIG